MSMEAATAFDHPETTETTRFSRLMPTNADHRRHRADGAAPGRVFALDAEFQTGGVWAGVGSLIEAAYLGLREIGSDAIIEEHDYELHMALPEYRHAIHPRFLCLTDIAVGVERTRFYPAERAYRAIHGLVSLVLKWKQAMDDRSRWIVAIHHFDRAQHLATRFFGELARRAADAHQIDVIIDTERLAADIKSAMPGMRTIPIGPDIAIAVPSVRSMNGAGAWPLDTDIRNGDESVLEVKFPTLLARYRRDGDTLAAARLAIEAMALYNRRGYYHEGKSLLPVILPCFDEIVGTDELSRMSILSEINSCLVATGDGEQAYRLMQERAVPHITRPHPLANMNYILAMHFLRYLDQKDLESAERHLGRAAEHIGAAAEGAWADESAFLRAFIDNGLAFLKVRQKRFQEALDLCSDAYDSVTRQMGADRHLLHRSVLKYNMAQVYAALQRFEEALACYRDAIAMDPYYAEYHAESGNILQQLERESEAIEFYTDALKYSPNYPEVYVRKGICHARLEEWDDALSCSGLCLEMDPDQPDIHAARAEIFAELGQTSAALTEYDHAIAIDGTSIAMRVNRAVLHYNEGAYDLALADMNAVIAREPQNPAHYENRAAIYEAMQRSDLYGMDMNMAERYKELA